MEEEKIRWRQQGRMSLRRPALYFAIIRWLVFFSPQPSRGAGLYWPINAPSWVTCP